MANLMILEQIFSLVTATVLTTIMAYLCYFIILPHDYSNLLVGYITWENLSKHADIIITPVCALVFPLTYIKSLERLQKGQIYFSVSRLNVLFYAVIGWIYLALILLILFTRFYYVDYIYIGFLLITFLLLAIFLYFPSRFHEFLDSPVSLFYPLSALFFALLPINFLPLINLFPTQYISYFIIFYSSYWFFVPLGIISLYTLIIALFPDLISKIRAIVLLIVIGQLSSAFLIFSLYPNKLPQLNDVPFIYETSTWLFPLLIVWYLFTIYDLYCHWKIFSRSKDFRSLVSPFACFPIAFILRNGSTTIPALSSDDYHFGEKLLGILSYIKGALPYIQYMPPHGLIDDDFAQLLSVLFYDGRAGSHGEATRLATAILGFAAYLSIFRLSRNMVWSVVVVLFLGERLSWLFLTIFVGVFFRRETLDSCRRWLFLYILVAPIIILGVPAQGIIFLASLFPLACIQTWLCFSHNAISRVNAKYIIIMAATCVCMVPLYGSLVGAIQYVIENSAINQVAYGLPWSLTWSSVSKNVIINYIWNDLIRFSWIIVTMFSVYIIYNNSKTYKNPSSLLYVSSFVFIFTFLMSPYAMGRIDQVGISRTGLLSIFSWTILFPLFFICVPRKKYVMPSICIASLIASLLITDSLSLSRFVDSVVRPPVISHSQSGAKLGISNLGNGIIDESHLRRTLSLRSIIQRRTTTADNRASYLDLSNHNAQYFYQEQKQPIYISAVYNIAAPNQQRRVVRQLELDPPQIVLVDFDNIVFDGAPLAFRNHLLYRYVISKYLPAFENGDIVGERKDAVPLEKVNNISISRNNLTNDQWLNGVNRSQYAIVTDDPSVLDIINIGDRVTLKDGRVMAIRVLSRTSGELWLSSLTEMEGERMSSLEQVTLMASQTQAELYRSMLFEKSLSRYNLEKLPISWGASLNSALISASHVLDLSQGAAVTVSKGSSVMLWDLSKTGLSGGDAGLVSFSSVCVSGDEDVDLTLEWSTEKQKIFGIKTRVNIKLNSGKMLIPLDVYPSWIIAERAPNVYLTMSPKSRCATVRIDNLHLYQRSLK